MQRPFFKLNRKSKFVTISPLGLALTACGGGSSEERPDVVSKVETHSGFVTFALTGNDFIDASTQGSKWVPTDGVITFAVADGLMVNVGQILTKLLRHYQMVCNKL